MMLGGVCSLWIILDIYRMNMGFMFRFMLGILRDCWSLLYFFYDMYTSLEGYNRY